jgi:1,4-alpha-glucan branching enzyme
MKFAWRHPTANPRRNGVQHDELADAVRRLLELRHVDPHSLLGAHPTAHGVVVRAFRPDAERVTLLADDGASWALERIDERGLFEVCVADRMGIFPYRLRVQHADGRVVTSRDPYTFLPSLGEVDLHLVGEARHEELYRKLGAHACNLGPVSGVTFAVWAPNACGVSVVGDFNSWDGRLHMMRSLGSSGIWELFIPELGAGTLYKYEIRTASGPFLKTDPFASAMQHPPETASIVHESTHCWTDEAWLAERAKKSPYREPLSIYEVHLGSWRRDPAQPERLLSYRELAPLLADHALALGFTHLEFLPVQEHPYAGSWGYQVSGYFAPTSRHGTPDDFKWLVDYLHGRGLGVVVDWVPAHFPKDAFALARFDGSALYEHQDPRQGEHPDWGTYIFNYGRAEVRNFLLASALYWLTELHVDGLRVDAVASMLYLDYSRNSGEWVPNPLGGRENLDALAFMKDLNQVVHRRCPGVLMIAEESTAWPAVSRPVELGGLGFGFKWNMGWMHDTLEYFSKDPIYRRYHHHTLTFALHYAFTENFVLALSHDEVVHGKGSLLAKMPGDRWQKLANLRVLYAHMWAHPGKKLLFMGGEFGQWREWNHDQSLDWHLLEDPGHLGLTLLVRDLNRLYRAQPALWANDADAASFQWIDELDAEQNVVAYQRIAPAGARSVICVGHFAPLARQGYRVGLPGPGWYEEVLNSDAAVYGGSNVGNGGGVLAEPIAWHGQPCSAVVTLPPLGCLWFLAPARPLGPGADEGIGASNRAGAPDTAVD